MGDSLSPYEQSLLRSRIRLSDRRIEQAQSNDNTFLGVNIGQRVDPRDAERLFETLTDRFSQIAQDQNVALERQTSLLRSSLRDQRTNARTDARLQRQLLNAQRAGQRDQRRLQQQGALVARDENRILANFNQNQRNQQMSDYLRNTGMRQFSLRQSLQELVRT